MTRSRLALGLMLAFSSVLQACAPRATEPPPTGAAQTAPVPPSVADVISNDPRFGNFAMVIKSAGLWSTLSGADGMTLFAPTNDAFDRSAPNWQANLFPYASSTGTSAGFARQRFIKSAVVAGVHSPAEFAGRVQSMTNINGTTFEADGRTPGVITIRSGPIPARSMGAKAVQPRAANASLPPIQAANGLIYPVDAIITR